MDTTNQTKGKVKHTPEELFQIYEECNVPGTPVKLVLQRHGIKPWELSTLRKRAREAILEAFTTPYGRSKKRVDVVPRSQYQSVLYELEETKDALAAVGHELALVKKRVNSV
jgi:transposase-like protein